MDKRSVENPGAIMDEHRPRDYLKRLPEPAYIGYAWVHWTMTIHNRRTGWLSPDLHLRWRELLLHTLCRYHMLCPAYVLMPDHTHVLLKGCTEDSHQLRAMAFLRKHFNRMLKEKVSTLQKQGYDHLLVEKESAPEGLPATIAYVLENPQKDGFVPSWKQWPYLGSVAPGFPDFSPLDEDFLDKLEAIHRALTGLRCP
jgi:REP element-mobilizing transposase RayT